MSLESSLTIGIGVLALASPWLLRPSPKAQQVIGWLPREDASPVEALIQSIVRQDRTPSNTHTQQRKENRYA